MIGLAIQKTTCMRTKILITCLAATLLYTACNNEKDKAETTNTATDTTKVVTNNGERETQGTVNEIIAGYLSLKNALTNDNNKEAATAAKQIISAVQNLDLSSLTEDQKKVYDQLKDDIKEHAEHIAGSSTAIAHQREHFDMLSSDMIDLVKSTGSSQILYRDFCPMYNNKKGASWLSETKEIKNPYYGKEMLTCGEVKEEIKPKG
jgi:hypothetical protein